MNILTVIGLAVLSGVLYRLGGYGKPFNTKVRDFGVPACMIMAMLSLGNFHWSLILCFGAMFGATTTYWDFINKWLPVKDKDTEYWFNWALHGFFIGISMLPYVLFSHQWLSLGLYVALCTVLMTLVSELSGNVWVEEIGRGFIAIAALFVFLL